MREGKYVVFTPEAEVVDQSSIGLITKSSLLNDTRSCEQITGHKYTFRDQPD